MTRGTAVCRWSSLPQLNTTSSTSSFPKLLKPTGLCAMNNSKAAVAKKKLLKRKKATMKILHVNLPMGNNHRVQFLVQTSFPSFSISTSMTMPLVSARSPKAIRFMAKARALRKANMGSRFSKLCKANTASSRTHVKSRSRNRDLQRI